MRFSASRGLFCRRLDENFINFSITFADANNFTGHASRRIEVWQIKAKTFVFMGTAIRESLVSPEQKLYSVSMFRCNILLFVVIKIHEETNIRTRENTQARIVLFLNERNKMKFYIFPVCEIRYEIIFEAETRKKRKTFRFKARWMVISLKFPQKFPLYSI